MQLASLAIVALFAAAALCAPASRPSPSPTGAPVSHPTSPTPPSGEPRSGNGSSQNRTIGGNAAQPSQGHEQGRQANVSAFRTTGPAPTRATGPAPMPNSSLTTGNRAQHNVTHRSSPGPAGSPLPSGPRNATHTVVGSGGRRGRAVPAVGPITTTPTPTRTTITTRTTSGGGANKTATSHPNSPTRTSTINNVSRTTGSATRTTTSTNAAPRTETGPAGVRNGTRTTGGSVSTKSSSSPAAHSTSTKQARTGPTYTVHV